MKDALGGYYTLGRVLREDDRQPRGDAARDAKYGLPRPTLMRFLLKLMANLAEPHGGDAGDRLITRACRKMAPAA